MALNMGDTGDYGSETPQPVDAASVANGAFDQLSAGQGAVSASHSDRPASRYDARQESKPMNKAVIAVIVVGALLAIALSVFLFVRILNGSSAKTEEVVEQAVVSRDEGISYRGSIYSIAEGEESYYLEETSESGGQAISLGDLDGDPVCLVLFNGALIIPENLGDDTWDVMAYTIGSGWSKIMDEDGSPRGGEGEISEARLDGVSLVLVANDETVSVPLEW